MEARALDAHSRLLSAQLLIRTWPKTPSSGGRPHLGRPLICRWKAVVDTNYPGLGKVEVFPGMRRQDFGQ